MHQTRPYRVWCKEVTSVTKEVFWIFLHQTNIVPIVMPDDPAAASSAPSSSAPTSTSFPSVPANTAPSHPANPAAAAPITAAAARLPAYAEMHFPKPRAPVPAAPYVGGVEWDATNYISAHLDLLNALVAALPTPAERAVVRRELRLSGFERLMGASLRLCKEKFYGAVHDGLRTWVAAAVHDAWPVDDVRLGPSAAGASSSAAPTPRASPVKKQQQQQQQKRNNENRKIGPGAGAGAGAGGGGGLLPPPKFELPRLELDVRLALDDDGAQRRAAKGKQGNNDAGGNSSRIDDAWVY
jgi:hypothetical protein